MSQTYDADVWHSPGGRRDRQLPCTLAPRSFCAPWSGQLRALTLPLFGMCTEPNACGWRQGVPPLAQPGTGGEAPVKQSALSGWQVQGMPLLPNDSCTLPRPSPSRLSSLGCLSLPASLSPSGKSGSYRVLCSRRAGQVLRLSGSRACAPLCLLASTCCLHLEFQVAEFQLSLVLFPVLCPTGGSERLLLTCSCQVESALGSRLLTPLVAGNLLRCGSTVPCCENSPQSLQITKTGFIRFL